MKINRYKNVQRVLCVLDKRINKLLISEKLNPKELVTLIDIRAIYIKEYDGLIGSKNTHDMFEKENGYGK